MANRTISGGPIAGTVTTFVPGSSWTDPAVGDLVKQSTSDNYEVAECTDTDVPIGIVRQVSDDSSVLTVELFRSGSVARLAYTGTPTRGQQIQASAAATVKGVASGGTGKVVGKDLVSGYVDVLFL
ncbi:MAG: hypothetical protein GF320_04495 [Armatimonadia bacterium]|nr:hypothetical protein [Armatimonadia bacterium]